MSAPRTVDVATFEVLSRYQGIDHLLDASRLAEAVGVHRAMQPGLDVLRDRPLPFLGDVPEPADALAWLEAGGVPR